MEEVQSHSIAKKPAYLMAAAALFLGGLFDYLFFEKNFGISVFIFEAFAVAVTLVFAFYFKQSYRNIAWLLVCILFFAAMVAVRDNMLLAFLNVLASAGLVLLAAQSLLKKQIGNFKISDYFFTIFISPFKILHRSFHALSFLTTPSQKSSTLVFRRVIVGIVLALPFLVIFGALFASADLAFKQLIDSIFRFTLPDELVGHLIFIIGTCAVALGLFAYLFNVPPEKKGIEKESVTAENTALNRNIEVKVFLWLIAGLFAVFLVFQVAYLFGGAINVSQGAFTYAEYARKGFWELLVVAFLSLLILLIMDRYTKSSFARTRWFTLPSLVLSAEVFIIIVSAFKRLMLYQSAYGLTTLRLYVSGFIIFLGIIFIILAIKLWREKEDSFFAFGALLSMIGFLVVFNLLNPDVFIAKQNIKRFNESGKVDVAYLGSLSADALPALLDVRERLNPEDQALLDKTIETKRAWLEKQAEHWQSYNVSRAKALKILHAQ